MQITRNTNLVNMCDALSGTWERTKTSNYVVTEQKDVTHVRMTISKIGPVILPLSVKTNTPYLLYGSNTVSGGIILPGQKSLNCETTGILDYIVL